MTIHCFLSEPLFTDQKLRIDYQESNKTGLFDNVLESCHSTPMYVKDQRLSRISLLFRPEPYRPVDTTMFLNDPIIDEWSDESRHGIMVESIVAESAVYVNSIDLSSTGENIPSTAVRSLAKTAELIVDRDRLSTAQNIYITSLDSASYDTLFNVIEYLSIGTLSSDLITDINNALVAESNGRFKGYVARSVVVSPLRDTAAVYNIDNTTTTIHRMVPRWFEFSFTSPSSGPDRIRVWLSTPYYKEKYPYSDIISIIPPFDPVKLINPGSLGLSIDELIYDSNSDAARLKSGIKDNNQTGVVTCATRFEWNDTSRQVTFTIIYRGHVPSIIEQKNAIAAYLVSTGVGGSTAWNGLLPDIFIANSFFLVPMYHVVKSYQTGGSYYPSIAYPAEAITILNALSAGVDTVSNNRRYLITIAYKRLFIGVFANDDNDTADLIDLHPTYRDFSSTDIGFIEMTTNTRDFSVKLNQAVALAMGETNSLSYTLSNIDGFNFITFTHGDSAYNVMTQSHYLQYYNQMNS